MTVKKNNNQNQKLHNTCSASKSTKKSTKYIIDNINAGNKTIEKLFNDGSSSQREIKEQQKREAQRLEEEAKATLNGQQLEQNIVNETYGERSITPTANAEDKTAPQNDDINDIDMQDSTDGFIVVTKPSKFTAITPADNFSSKFNASKRQTADKICAKMQGYLGSTVYIHKRTNYIQVFFDNSESLETLKQKIFTKQDDSTFQFVDLKSVKQTPHLNKLIWKMLKPYK